MRIAVVGAGVSGLTAARLLCKNHEVTVYEAGRQVGGHAYTHSVICTGQEFSVDLGFMVYNHQTYPQFTRVLEKLQVPSRPSDMSFGVSCNRTGLEYRGGTGFLARWDNLTSSTVYRMMIDILRFHHWSSRRTPEELTGLTVGELLCRAKVGKSFRTHYFLPMAAAIWSCRPGDIENFPAAMMLRFCRNHGLLQIGNRPQWRTILGGSISYVDTLTAPFRDHILLNTPVVKVCRATNHVEIHSRTGECCIYDAAVLAVHADDALRILVDADSTEQALLSTFSYGGVIATLHQDTSILPRSKGARASWNARVISNDRIVFTYDLSRLQGHNTDEPLLLTLDGEQLISPAKVLGKFPFRHPKYTLESLKSQSRFNELNSRGSVKFCGAYWGYGFHEDGVVSAIGAVQALQGSVRDWTADFTWDT